jgi:hypothetical protein
MVQDESFVGAHLVVGKFGTITATLRYFIRSTARQECLLENRAAMVGKSPKP